MKSALIVAGVLTVVLVLLLRTILRSSAGSTMGIRRISNAIATAEGFFVSGSRPQRNNNPGNLKEDLTGKATGTDGPFVRYGSALDGWEALDRQVQLMFEGSRYYRPSMTIYEIAQRYTSTDVGSWANTVAGKLGVSTQTKLEDV